MDNHFIESNVLHQFEFHLECLTNINISGHCKKQVDWKLTLNLENQSYVLDDVRNKIVSAGVKSLRTKTISYKSIGVTSNKDFLYVVVPKILHSISYKDHFVQRPFHTKETVQKPNSQFCIWVFDRVRFCFFCFCFFLYSYIRH